MWEQIASKVVGLYLLYTLVLGHEGLDTMGYVLDNFGVMYVRVQSTLVLGR